MKAFGLSPELFEALQDAEVLKADADGSFDLASVAANLFNYGMANARTANERLLAAASALNETLPALQRLSDLPHHGELDDAARSVGHEGAVAVLRGVRKGARPGHRGPPVDRLGSAGEAPVPAMEAARPGAGRPSLARLPAEGEGHDGDAERQEGDGAPSVQAKLAHRLPSQVCPSGRGLAG